MGDSSTALQPLPPPVLPAASDPAIMPEMEPLSLRKITVVTRTSLAMTAAEGASTPPSEPSIIIMFEPRSVNTLGGTNAFKTGRSTRFIGKKVLVPVLLPFDVAVVVVLVATVVAFSAAAAADAGVPAAAALLLGRGGRPSVATVVVVMAAVATVAVVMVAVALVVAVVGGKDHVTEPAGAVICLCAT